MLKRLDILNVWVDPVNMDQAIKKVCDFLESKNPHSIFAVNPEKNFSVPKDEEFYRVFKKADLLIPDGIGVVLAAKILHGINLDRIPGVEFMGQICKIALKMEKSIFIFGAKEDVSRAAAEKLELRYPGLKIAGRSNGYVKDEEMADLVKKINQSGADILFLALGSPKQEKWFEKYASQLTHVRVCQGIGGTLDTIAGTVKRAPAIWQKFSAEWLYRLISEPKRIKRQKVLPIFAYLVLKEKFKSLFGKQIVTRA